MPAQILTHTKIGLLDVVPDALHPVRLRARDLAAAELLRAHSHPWGQVTYAPEGVLRVSVGNSTWIVPPLRAIWIPPLVEHEIATMEKSQLRALYIDTDAAPFDGQDCIVLEVSTLLRELIAALTQTDDGSRRESLLGQLILNELGAAKTPGIRISLPTEKRLHAICQALIETPDSSMTLAGWAEQVGASERTLARLFERDLGMTFGQWRQQIRLAHAASMIARGMPLSLVAAELGYASQSAFSAMFRKTFGQSPSTFFAPKKSNQAAA
ncbi:helix-turn-helix transcriptional regulator [Collimonas sp.]|jgi:AraC-like DNA-binding protein|uniref:AraC family transcriptional regulator n=1 Tax=Collimonas sp. TaxID=1963772 RepID=UPI002C6F3CF6|nr:helix-turn-helix transcriptional regulator [Collimonas sp.]HWW04898.1 helix-turn-helix transcriptional regulator [Collimonas sp.]